MITQFLCGESSIDGLKSLSPKQRLILVQNLKLKMDGSNYHKIASGVPQGGSLSPLLANVALHGMENRISKRFRGAKLVRYADEKSGDS